MGAARDGSNRENCIYVRAAYTAWLNFVELCDFSREEGRSLHLSSASSASVGACTWLSTGLRRRATATPQMKTRRSSHKRRVVLSGFVDGWLGRDPLLIQRPWFKSGYRLQRSPHIYPPGLGHPGDGQGDAVLPTVRSREPPMRIADAFGGCVVWNTRRADRWVF